MFNTVEENRPSLTCLCEQQVVQVSVSDSQDVRDDTVSSCKHTNKKKKKLLPLLAFLQEDLRGTRKLTAALDISVHHLRADTVGTFFAGCMLPKEALLEQ